MNIDIHKLETALAAKDLESARAIIRAAIAADLTPEEEGASLVAIANIYLDISNAISEQYLATLKDAITGLRMVNEAERAHEDKLKLAEVRADLQK